MNPLNNSYRNVANVIKTVSNPMNMLGMNNPQVQEVMKICNGRNPRDVFYQMCKERNIDPNSILSQLK